MAISKNLMYLGVMLLFVVLYGLFSSSTPDDIGWSEILIGFILVALVGMRHSLNLLSIGTRIRNRNKSGIIVPDYIYAIFLYFVFVPTLVGLIIIENDIVDFVRDFIPFLYFFLPLLLVHRVHSPVLWAKSLIVALCFIGVAFSIRHFVEGGYSFFSVGQEIIFGTKAYFTQDPAVPFAGAFLSCYGIWLLVQRKIINGFILLGFAVFPWLAILGTALRAPLGLIIISVVVMVVIAFWKSRRTLLSAFVILLLSLIVVYFLYDKIAPQVSGALDLMWQKQERVGDSGRLEEFSDVIHNASTGLILLLGEGWGGIMSNPTGDGASFRFTHNVVSYFLLKTGVVGTVFLFIYLHWILKKYLRFVNNQTSGYQLAAFLAIGVTLLIHLIIEPGYKMMPLGLVFMLAITLSSINNKFTK